MARYPLAVVLILLLLPAVVGAAPEPLSKLRAGVPPYTVIGEIMKGHQAGVGTAAVTPAGQVGPPYLVWLADPDSRLRPELIMAGRSDRIYTVRNLGNQVEPAAAALDYGVRVLHTPVLLITGNTDSEAIRWFSQGYEALGEAIRRELNQLHPALAKLALAGKEAKSPEAAQARLDRMVEANVDYQVARAVERYRDRVENGRLVVVGAVLDLAGSYGGGPGRLFLININGESEAEKMRKSPHLVRLDQRALALVGRHLPPAEEP